MYKTVIIDDENAAIRSLKLIIGNYCPQLEVVGTAGNVLEGIDTIKSNQPDIAFLDVELQGGTGFNILEEIQSLNVHVVFITAHNHHALRAFKYSSIDYIQKPIDIDELIEKVNRIICSKQSISDVHKKYKVLFDNVYSPYPQFIIVSGEKSITSVRAEEIIMVKRHEIGSVLFLKDGSELESIDSVNEFQEIMEESGFFRINDDYLIQVKCIKKIQRLINPKVKMVNDLSINVGRGKLSLLVEVCSNES